MNTWPDAGITPFRGEKNTNWEGAFRVPAMVRWQAKSRRVVCLMKLCIIWIGCQLS